MMVFTKPQSIMTINSSLKFFFKGETPFFLYAGYRPNR